MRILHLLGVGRLSRNPDEQALSGLTRAVLNLARVQASNGHQVTVATFDNVSWSSKWRNIHLVGLKPVLWARVKFGSVSLDYRNHLAAVRFTSQQRFDVVQGHNYSYFRMIKARIKIVTFHGDPLYYGWTSSDFTTAKKYCTQFVAVSQFISSVVSRELGFTHNRIPVVPNGVDHELFNSKRAAVMTQAKRWRETLGIHPNNPVFLYAGAISVEKGTRELALAFRQLLERVPNAVLLVAGTSHIWGSSLAERTITTFEKEVREILASCGTHVHFLGNVSGNDMPGVYAMSDVVVVPSTVKEGFGLVALESMSCGRPVIATRVGGLPEVVDENCGLLVDPEDVKTLSEAMRELALQPGKRLLMGGNGTQKAKYFSWEQAATKLDVLYQS